MHSLANKLEVMVIAYCRSNGYPLIGVHARSLPNRLLKYFPDSVNDLGFEAL